MQRKTIRGRTHNRNRSTQMTAIKLYNHIGNEAACTIITQSSRRVVLCQETHCNIGSKSACYPLGSDVELSHLMSTVHLWRRAVPLQTFPG